MKGAFPPRDPNILGRLGYVARIANHQVGLDLVDRAHHLLGGESSVRFRGGQRRDAIYLARVDVDVLRLDSRYVFGFDQGSSRVYGVLPPAGESE